MLRFTICVIKVKSPETDFFRIHKREKRVKLYLLGVIDDRG